MSVALQNRWIWITGASSGIGKGLARRLLKRGNNLILTARNRVALEEIRDLDPQKVSIITADISTPECADKLKDQLTSITPYLDTVILNAGNCEYIDADNFDIDIVERITQVNYLGFARCIHACLPLLERSSSKPHIVGISSASAFFGLPRAEAYGASKAALSHFLESLRVDIHRKGISVSVVYPGFVDTPLTRKNDFPMPGILTQDQACEKILTGIEKRQHTIAFPRLLIWSLKLLALLPSKWSVRFAQRFVLHEQA